MQAPQLPCDEMRGPCQQDASDWREPSQQDASDWIVIQYVLARMFLLATSIESIARQVAAALKYFHNAKGLVHLGVKSANILFRQDDGRAALSDFGMTEPIKTKKPRFGIYVTANYRAPELWGASRPNAGVSAHTSCGCFFIWVCSLGASGSICFQDWNIVPRPAN